MNKILYHTVRLHCTADRAFEMFTKNDHLQKWLTISADVEPTVGGKYELFWNPENKESDSTIGCKIMALEPGKFLAFEWKGPKQYEGFMNTADPLTHVVVFFIPCGATMNSSDWTEVHLIHSGWRSSAEWEEARIWFEKDWDVAFKNLKEYVDGLCRM